MVRAKPHFQLQTQGVWSVILLSFLAVFIKPLTPAITNATEKIKENSAALGQNTTHEKITFYRDPSTYHRDYNYDDDDDNDSYWDIPVDTEHVTELSDADYYSERERYDEFEREVALEFRPLCSTIRRRVYLKDDLFEYRPSHFTEVLCRKFGPLVTHGPHGYRFKSYSYHKYEQQCAYDGFKCIQRSQAIYLSRRRRDGDCWETTRQIIPSGCDCMWPISTLGEIKEIY